jgi:hypothetical protein
MEVPPNIVTLRPIRGEMFIESPASKRFFPAPAERNMNPGHVPLPETLRSAGARLIGFVVLSINISLRRSENEFHFALGS